MATKGMSVFTHQGEDYTINDPNNAPEFSTGTAYAKGQYVTYQGDLYRFTSDHSAGAWNSEHTTQVKVCEELAGEKTARENGIAELRSALSYKLSKAEFDIPFKEINDTVIEKIVPAFSTGCVYANGQIHTEYSQYSYTQKISVKTGDVVKAEDYTAGIIGKQIRYIAAYSDSCEIMPSAGSDSNVTSYTVQNGVAFVVLSLDMSSTQDYKVLVETKGIQLKDKANSPSVNSLLKMDLQNVFDTEPLAKKIIYEVTESIGQMLPNGYVYPTDSFSHTQKIPVEKGDKIRTINVSIDFEGGQMRYVTAYKDDTAVETKGKNTTSYEYDVPEGINYVVITYENDRYASTGIQIARYTGRLYLKNENVSKELKVFANAPEIIVPEKAFAVVGHEWNMYYDNISVGLSDEYYMFCSGISGKSYERFLRFTPEAGDIGTHTVTVGIYVKATHELITSKTFDLIVVADSTPTKKVMFVGDSLTEEGTYINEIQNVLSDGDIESVGTRTETTTSDYQNIHHEGRSGWNAYDLTEKANIGDVTNAFWNPSTGKFDFSYYANTAYPAAIGSSFPGVDCVMLNVGTNGVNNVERTCGAIDEIITSIRNYDSNIIVIVSLITPPATQDGCGQHNGMFDSYLWKIYETNLIKAYLEKYEGVTENVYVSEPYFNIDREYDFPTRTVSVSSRNPAQITIQDNNVHPNIYGYLKMADVYYANLLYRLSE